MEYCVYKHTSPDGKIYIGITSQKPPSKRWRKNGSGYKFCPHFYGAIKKYGWENFEHEILLDGLSVEEAQEKEKELISKFNSCNNKYGYNISVGGIGGVQREITEETRKKLSESARKSYITNPKLRKLRSENSKNRYIDDPNRRKQVNQNISNGKKKKVVQLTLEGNFVKIWDSLGDAQEKLGISNISYVCRGNRKSAGGYIWKYLETWR